MLTTVPGGISNSPVPIANTASASIDHREHDADDDRPRPHPQRDRLADAQDAPRDRERAHSCAIRFRRTSAMNNGVPTTAIITPAGSSPGRTTTRPITSATSISAPPSTAE